MRGYVCFPVIPVITCTNRRYGFNGVRSRWKNTAVVVYCALISSFHHSITEAVIGHWFAHSDDCFRIDGQESIEGEDVLLYNPFSKEAGIIKTKRQTIRCWKKEILFFLEKLGDMFGLLASHFSTWIFLFFFCYEPMLWWCGLALSY